MPSPVSVICRYFMVCQQEEEKKLLYLTSSYAYYIYSPAHSMILDVDEESWTSVFTKEELMEIHNEDPPLIRQTPDELVCLLNDIRKMVKFFLSNQMKLFWYICTLLN